MGIKNTFIPLNMILVRSDGRILRIAENTRAAIREDYSLGGLVKGG